MADDKIDDILSFWFGRVEDTINPSDRRAHIWFSDAQDIDLQVKGSFSEQTHAAEQGDCSFWEKTPQGRLALILVLDQFSRHIYRNTANMFANDPYALAVCVQGMLARHDHALSLIERAFYYYPLLHAETLQYQKESVRAYRLLLELSLPETRAMYESFFKFATHHYNIVQRFGRFPQRNFILDRISTPEEAQFLKELE